MSVLKAVTLEKIIAYLISSAVAALIAFNVWAAKEMTSRPTRDDVMLMLETQAPYIEDRKAIFDRMETMGKMEGLISSVIRQNTEAINSLKVEIAKLSVITGENR